MTSVTNILDEIEGTQGTNAKIAILDRESKNDLLKQAIFAATDPYATYFVSKFKMPPPVGNDDVSSDDDDELVGHFVTVVLKSLHEREYTGNAAKAYVEESFSHMNARQQKWCQRFLLRKLRIGIQESSIEKVWPGLVKSFSVSLAETVKSDFVKGSGIKILQDIKYPVRVEPKLDGLRCVAVKVSGQVTFYTRNGTVLDTVPTIKAALESCAEYDNLVLDGELLANGTWNDTVSIVMSSKKHKDDADLIFNVFDCVLAANWVSQDDNVPYKDRLELVDRVIKMIGSDKVQPVAHIVAENERELKKYFKKCMDEGFEGVMLKTVDAPYLFKRSANILKLKPVVTYEGVIVGNYEGRRGTKREGLFGGFEVVLSNGTVTRIGGGFTDAVRADIALAGEESFIGKIVEIEAQPDPTTEDGLSADGKARFPVFIRFRSESDVDPKVVQAGIDYFDRDDEPTKE